MVDRREVLEAAVTIGLTGLLPRSAHAVANPSDYMPAALTLDEMATVKAIMSRLVPADADSGGAVEACAHVYLDKALGGFLAQHLAAYRSGLAAVEGVSESAHKSGFASINDATKDLLLASMESGTLYPGFADGGRGFFALIRRHTVEGMFSDPIYGGNQGFIGWSLIGFHGVRYFYPPEAQAINGTDRALQRSIASYGGQPRF
jgi:gluconate 2-dehydrogenase gamma chain